MQKNTSVLLASFLIIGILAGYFFHQPLNKDDQAAASNANAKAIQNANSNAKANANPHSALAPCPPPAGTTYGTVSPSPTNPGPQTISFGTVQFTVLEFQVESYNCALWLDTLAGSVKYVSNPIPTGTPPLVTNFKLYDVTAGYPGIPVPSSTFRCSDGVDNDYDSLVDFPADPGCFDAQDEDETSATFGNLGFLTIHPNGPSFGYPINPGPGNIRKFAIKADVGAPGPIISTWPWNPGVLFTANISGEAKDFACTPYMTCPFIDMDTPQITSSVITFQ